MHKFNNSKIVYVINTMEIGGAAKMLKFVVNKTKHLFNEVYIITLNDEAMLDLGDNVIHINDKIKVNSSQSKIKGLWRLFSIIKLRKIINEINPTIICSFISDVTVTTRLASIGNKAVYIAAERGDPYTLPFYWKRLVKFAYKYSDYCVFQTYMARDFFTEKIRDKSYIIPNPFIKSQNSIPDFTMRKKTVVSAGRFSPEKGFDLLIKAFYHIHKKYPEYKLIIYGDGNEKEYFEELVSKLGIKDSVKFPGYVDNISEHLKNDGIFVLPSHYEGMPNSMIEAMGVSMPVIATDCTPGGPRFLTNNGERGILIPIGDIEAIKKNVEMLIENPCVAKKYSEKAYEIIEVLDSSKIQKQWIKLYQTILTEKR